MTTVLKTFKDKYMSYDKLHIDLIRSKDDEPLENKKYQAELIEFSKLLPKNSSVTSTMYAMDSICGGGGLAGQFMLALALSIIPAIAAAAQWWLNSRTGRRVRLKVGDVEVEA